MCEGCGVCEGVRVPYGDEKQCTQGNAVAWFLCVFRPRLIAFTNSI